MSADPKVIDKEAKRVWTGIYQGNVPKHEQWPHAMGFMFTFARFIPRATQPAQVAPITPERVLQAFTKTSPSAPGPDAWLAQDLKHMPSAQPSICACYTSIPKVV